MEQLRRHLEAILVNLPERPRAILVVSGHWELEPLQDEGVLIVGSASSYHNLHKSFGDDDGASVAFDKW